MSNHFYSAEENIQIVVSLLKAYGIKRIIASPGTTNLTFVASLMADPFFKIYSAPEERSAAYMAVGMAEESGEPVVITCTGATASRNYLPGLTEAFYRKLPLLAITATQPLGSVGQLVPQVIDRSALPKDAAVYSVHIGTIKDRGDRTTAILKANEAFHYLSKNGGGPVHINLETTYDKDFSVKDLPSIPKIGYYRIFDELPEIPNGKVGIYVGSHSKMSAGLNSAIDRFCDRYGAVVFCDHTSNYKGKYRFLYPLALSQDNWLPAIGSLTVVIYIGEVSGSYSHPGGKQLWRVSEDGKIRSVFGLPKAVFEMREEDFFNRYADKGCEGRSNFIEECRETYQGLLKDIPDDIPFSNIWVARELAPKIPDNSVIHFGILNSLRSWNFFEIPASVDSYCNVGGFGIDGPISTVIGGALANPEKIHYLIVGDLAFFYDLNALGNRHLPANLRIILINNGKGTEFRNYNHPAHAFGEEADLYMAAGGHYGAKSANLVKSYAEALGIEYLTADNKTNFHHQEDILLNPEKRSYPLLFEIFTDSELENEALHTIRNLRVDGSSVLKNKVRNILGKNGVETIKKVFGK
ncbi:MAG: 2-succinyl-5-enolpyruvyl-6-hydroxy-3-cyclohexene-1-carboxylate synthase [Bacteroidales bacterium]|nr:2-succinyl-5-enolpyruvyl-6-hydroxy-3-cyclohexene-1-carboxylate synthase [Bacteroidales bacterium]